LRAGDGWCRVRPVNWNSFVPTAISSVTNGTLYSPLFGGGATGTGGIAANGGNTLVAGQGYYYELLYFATANNGGIQVAGNSAPSNSFATLFGGGWLDTGLEATNAITAGRLAGVAFTSSAAVPWANGQTDSVVLVGWSANLGTTWLSVSNTLANWNNTIPGAFFGVSTAGYINPATGNPGAGPFATAAQSYGLPINEGSTVGPMTLYAMPVPEPGTMALAGLGGLGLLLFRRRK
jgi:hypothetical protein